MTPIPRPAGGRPALLLLFVVVISGCLPPSGPARGASSKQLPEPVRAITAVQYEQRCFGCTSELVVLRQDGSATKTRLGSLRAGTADTTYSGVLAAADFEALARLLVEQGFFELGPEYTNPALADGRQITITVTASGGDVRVRESNAAGPPALRTIVQTLDTTIQKIPWKETR